MGLMERAKQDVQQILGNKNEFALDLVFFAPTGETFQTVGHFFDRTIQYNIDDSSIAGNTVVVHVSEQPFIDFGYPLRDSNGLISIHNHLVTGTYADGQTKKFKVFSFDPDYSINLITIYLSHYADN